MDKPEFIYLDGGAIHGNDPHVILPEQGDISHGSKTKKAAA